MEFIVFLVMLFVFLVYSGQKKRKSLEAAMRKNVANISQFNASQTLLSSSLLSCLAIDEVRKKIALLNVLDKKGHCSTRVFDYRQILSCEILEDGDSITKTSRMSQAGGLVVGGVLLGGLGAVVGGLSGKKTSSKTIEKLAVLLIVNDTREPRFEITLNASKVDSTTDEFKQLLEKARHWHSIISVLIRQADDAEVTKQVPSLIESDKKSLADELKKLKELVAVGVLTEQEFLDQKTKLLKNT